jgi:hypothetical protein
VVATGSRWVLTRLETVLRVENLDPSDPLHDYFVQKTQRTRAVIAAEIRTGEERGEIRSDINPDVKAIEIVAFGIGMETQSLLTSNAIDRDQVHQSFARALIDDLTRPDAPRESQQEESRSDHQDHAQNPERVDGNPAVSHFQGGPKKQAMNATAEKRKLSIAPKSPKNRRLILRSALWGEIIGRLPGAPGWSVSVAVASWCTVGGDRVVPKRGSHVGVCVGSGGDIAYSQRGHPLRGPGRFWHRDPPPAGLGGTLHRHGGPVYGFTSEGRWGHDTNFDYRRGTYVYEVPGIIHRFMSGSDGPVQAFFVEYGGIEAIDEESFEPIVMLGVKERVALYFDSCEAAGLPRPNILY